MREGGKEGVSEGRSERGREEGVSEGRIYIFIPFIQFLSCYCFIQTHTVRVDT